VSYLTRVYNGNVKDAFEAVVEAYQDLGRLLPAVLQKLNYVVG
jgi:predicted RNase H-like HicB family nuclease